MSDETLLLTVRDQPQAPFRPEVRRLDRFRQRLWATRARLFLNVRRDDDAHRNQRPRCR